MRRRSPSGSGAARARPVPDAGQGSVELIALLPLLVMVGLGLVQVLAAGVVHGLAANAAENGAIALGDGEDPRDAAREALPGWARERVRITVSGRRVSVRLTPVTIFPGAGEALATVARADAGPEPAVTGRSAPAPAAGPGLGAPAGPTRDDPNAGAAPAARAAPRSFRAAVAPGGSRPSPPAAGPRRAPRPIPTPTPTSGGTP